MLWNTAWYLAYQFNYGTQLEISLVSFTMEHSLIYRLSVLLWNTACYNAYQFCYWTQLHILLIFHRILTAQFISQDKIIYSTCMYSYDHKPSFCMDCNRQFRFEPWICRQWYLIIYFDLKFEVGVANFWLQKILYKGEFRNTVATYRFRAAAICHSVSMWHPTLDRSVCTIRPVQVTQ